MTAPRRSRGGDPAAVRGLIVLVVAAAVGIVLLAKSGGGLTHSNTATKTGTTTTLAASVSTTTVPVTPTTHPPASVTVAVLNGTGGAEPNASSENIATLKPLGYTTLPPNDVKAQTTAVYYLAGYQADAQAIAKALGLPSSSVQPMPATPPTFAVGGTAQVYVVIGTDHSGSTSSGSTSSGSTSSGSTSSGTSGTGTGTSGNGTSSN